MKKIYVFLIKNLLCISLFLGIGIVCKLNVSYKDYVQKKLYQDNFDFSSFRVFYNQYLGGIFPIENISNNGLMSVFHEKLVYQEAIAYEDGVMLKVNYNYLVPSIDKGIVVYVGEKDKYGNVIIVEGDDGIDIWYGNLCDVMVKLYDGVNSGDYLGQSCDNIIYVVYTKKNEILNYQDYLE